MYFTVRQDCKILKWKRKKSKKFPLNFHSLCGPALGLGPGI